MRHRVLPAVLGSWALLGLIVSGQAQLVKAAPRFAVTDLGTLPGGDHSGAYGINNKGQTVGWSDVGEDKDGNSDPVMIHNHAVLWDQGKAEDLGLLRGFPYSAAQAINAKGQVIGGWEVHYRAGNGGGPAGLLQTFLWQRGRKTLLDLLTVTAINGRGQIVGSSRVPATGERHPALLTGRKKTILGLLPGGTGGAATGVNNAGEVVGWIMGEASNKTNEDYRAFLYKGGRMINLGGQPLGRGDTTQNFSQSFAINDKGRIAGTVGFRAAYWEQGEWHRLGSFPGYDQTTAYSINNGGQIVGEGDTGEYQQSHAFLYQEGTLRDLNDLIPPRSGWVLKTARGINNRGQIVGSGERAGKERAFLLTPLPNPSRRGQESAGFEVNEPGNNTGKTHVKPTGQR